MAEKVLFAIAKGLLESLGSLAKGELELLWGIGDELEKLKNTVSTIELVILDAEKKQHADPAVKHWLGMLEDILYDADDLLDDISTEALRAEVMKDKKGKVRMFFSKPKQLAYGFKIGHKIKVIRERLDATAAIRRFHLEERREETRVDRDRERDNTHSFVHAENVFGREDDKDAVIRLLMDSDVEENVSVIPIVGLGGLGKTTLAQLIFNDKKIEESFELKSWICVSDIFIVKEIVENILESATKKKPKSNNMDLLVSDLQQKINGKKYLLVLDDVWNTDPKLWSSLKELLIGGAKGSRILVTTRDEKVAQITSRMEPYVLRCLDVQSSWLLFKKVAFKNIQQSENPMIVDMSRKILEKCAGVPLAVKTIGGLLYFKNPETEWISFTNNELLKVSQKENDILPTLRLSYNHLPSHLKQCFTYCCIFPKDSKLDKSLLVGLWMAQGFIKLTEENQCLEDIGHEYFMDLLWGSFFQEFKIDEFGNVSCKMHDLMHDLATEVGRAQIIVLHEKQRHIEKKIRHVSISEEVPTSLYKASGLRTFLNPYKFASMVDCKMLFTNFKSLRTLDLCHRWLKYVSSSIGDLKHLRYLDLSMNYELKKLPNGITKLQNLQTLKLLNCYDLTELPRGITALVDLRHLDLFACRGLKYMPLGLSQMTNLQTLSSFAVGSGSFRHGCALDELKEMNNLSGRLSIINLRHGKDVVSEYNAANLKAKSHIHTLELCWGSQGAIDDDASNEMLLEGFQPQAKLKSLSIHGYGGSTFPSWLWSLTSLVELSLNDMKCQYLPQLSCLPYLKNLGLRGLPRIKCMKDTGDNYEFPSCSSSPAPFFPSLEKLFLEEMGSLEWCWWKMDSFKEVNDDDDNSIEKASEELLVPSFPRLSELWLRGCPRLTSIPLFPHLEFLVLGDTTLKLLQPTLTMNTSTETSSTLDVSSCTPLSKLKEIDVCEIEELENLQDEVLQNLVSVECMRIGYCHNVKSLSGLQNFTKLKFLHFYYCPELELANDEDLMQRPWLQSLLHLRFVALSKLVSLPLWLQHATSLQTLEIDSCKFLTAIPEWFSNCTSSLQTLQILRCPILLRRCKKEKGEDWSKIAHIPNLELGFTNERSYYIL